MESQTIRRCAGVLRFLHSLVSPDPSLSTVVIAERSNFNFTLSAT
jgi:hypothetical protein